MNTDKQLTVKVMSFSYRKGIPEDTSGNGGGYVFDCRYVHNPGRYDEYKPLTGLDKPVIDFLENDGEITEFLTHVYALTDAHVKPDDMLRLYRRTAPFRIFGTTYG